MRMIITTLGLNVKAAGSFLTVAIMTQKKMIILRCEVQDGWIETVPVLREQEFINCTIKNGRNDTVRLRSGYEIRE